MEAGSKMATQNELSWEESNRLFGMSTIPSLIVVFIVLIYFVHLMQNDLLKSPWDYLIHVFLPLVTGAPIVAFLSFEILYSRKIKKTLMYHLKRFLGRTFVLLASTSSLFGFFIAANAVLSELMGWENSLIVGGIIWVLTFSLIATRFRKLFTKLNKGKW